MDFFDVDTGKEMTDENIFRNDFMNNFKYFNYTTRR